MEKAAFPVSLLYRTLGVSRPGFYAWQARSPAPRAAAVARLGLEIAALYAESWQRYGSPRIRACCAIAASARGASGWRV